MSIGSLFSGIGGLEMGLESLGLGPVKWQCDSDPHSLTVLNHHWPEVKKYSNIKDIDSNAERVTLICGGFPCQPHSVAGKRKGTTDVRWLWPEFSRVIETLKPTFVFIENVPGLRSSGMRDVLADLAHLRFNAEWGVYSAAQVGAPHIRKRLFILAYANGLWKSQPEGCVTDIRRWFGHDRLSWPLGDPNGKGLEGRGLHDITSTHKQPPWPPGPEDSLAWRNYLETNVGAEPAICGKTNGVRGRTHRLRLLGNACVPQQAAYAFQDLITKVLANSPVKQEGS